MKRTKIKLTKTSYIIYDHITSTYTLWERLPGAYIERALTAEQAKELIRQSQED